jgi:phosphomannomutase/phosphoglucomutase
LFHKTPKPFGNSISFGKCGTQYNFVNELGALAGFERSGHFFFNPPLGRGYDDGLVAAIAVCDLIDRNPGRSLADLYDGLPLTWSSPTLSAACPDEVKYDVADRVRQRIERIAAAGGTIAGRPLADLVTVNGIRVVADDGTWGLVRASSNKPELVVVVESPVSEARMRAMFSDIDAILRENSEVGAYNQAI